MKDEHISYLKSLGMTDVLVARVQSIFDFYRGTCPEEIEDVFVCELIDGEGVRQFESAYFFSTSCAMEAKSFVSNDDFDMTPIAKRVVYWEMKKQDYDLQTATEKSRLNIAFNLNTRIGAQLKASKANCDKLRDVFRARVLANVVT